MECSSYLPAELWSKVLRFVTLRDADEDDELFLLHPCTPHHLSLANKRAVVQVCRKWRTLAVEYLWESVGNLSLPQLLALADYLSHETQCATEREARKSSHPNPSFIPRGWWIRSLVTRFNFDDDLTTFVRAITAIFPYCPNLISFKHIHDYNGPLPSSVITTLANNCGRTLVRFQLDWGGVNIDDLIHLLDQSTALQHIALGCSFDPPSINLLPLEYQELRKRDFHFPNLRSLHFGNSEDGMFRKFNSHLLEATSWSIPSLTAVVIDLDARTSIEEVTGFLQAHGRKLKTLSLTDSGRDEGAPFGWNEIFRMCPQVTDMRLAYKPFVNFNIEAFAVNFFAREDVGDAQAELSVAPGVAQEEFPILPRLITSPSAVHLQRLCFDKWEFFPGMDCTLNAHANTGDDGNMLLPSADEFLARVTSPEDAEGPMVEQGVGERDYQEDMEKENEDIAAQENSERLLKAYRTVLDHVFEAIGGKMTPALRVIQFDFQAGRLVLPESCYEWWNGWVSEWRSRGLRVEGCRRVPL